MHFARNRLSVGIRFVPCVESVARRRNCCALLDSQCKTKLLSMSSRVTTALRSWLKASGRSARATGNECARIIPRITTSRAPVGMSRVPFPMALLLTWSIAPWRRDTFMSLGLTQGISPPQYAGFAMLGVPPLNHFPMSPSRTAVQSAGIGPSSVCL